MTTEVKKKKSFVDNFVEGSKNGLQMGLFSMTPNIILAFIIIHILDLTGLLILIERVFHPLMGLFGLPGVSATVLAGSFLSMGGGVGVAGGLIAAGELTARHVVVLFPALYLMGSQIQFIGRVGGTAELPARFRPHVIIISCINAILSLILMNILV